MRYESWNGHFIQQRNKKGIFRQSPEEDHTSCRRIRRKKEGGLSIKGKDNRQAKSTEKMSGGGGTTSLKSVPEGGVTARWCDAKNHKHHLSIIVRQGEDKEGRYKTRDLFYWDNNLACLNGRR